MISTIKILISIGALFVLFIPNIVFAKNNPQENSNQFITIVNPVRISSYTVDPVKSIASEYSELSKRDLPASWLFTYDVLEKQEVADFVKQMDSRQDLGIFLEVTPNFSKAAGVVYNKTDSWHRSNSVFLIGYTQEDRKKFIDTVFDKFKKDFGYYPKSVGAWWSDSFSLGYMKEKYGITATLGCADQFYTDGYSLWGQYWSIPFYPSRNHSGMPARNLETKLDLVSFQWAVRDPYNGYSGERASSFSTQDYYTRSLPDSYFEKLIKLYALAHQNRFGQITLGLEGDFPANSYQGLFATQMDIIKRISREENITVTNMVGFSDWYRRTFPNLSPAQVIESEDLLGSKIKSIWYQSPAYRIGLTINPENRELKIIDWRVYQDNFQEPFYLTPNTQLNLYTNTPSLIDQISDPKSVWQIPVKGSFSISGNNAKSLLSVDGKPLLTFEENNITVYNSEIPEAINKSDLLEIKKSGDSTKINITEHWITSQDGFTFWGLPPQYFYFINSYNLSKMNNIKRLSIAAVILILVLLAVYKFKLHRKKFFWKINIALFLGIILVIILISKIYMVSQAETDALLHLKAQNPGRVVVFDETCLKCTWHNRYMPAALANNRGYVSQISKKPIIYNRSIFVAKDRPTGKKLLDGLKAKYIYIVKYENYTESLPFSPGDYNLDLIFENANAQIWRIRS